MNKITEPILERNERDHRLPGAWSMGFCLVAGVMLPTAALVVELAGHFCAHNFFDPIPTWWHVLLVAFVPATNLQTWLAFRNGHTVRPAWLSFANAVSILISLYYALIFAPLVPIAVVAILLLFLGLLPLAPLVSLIAAVVMRFNMQPLYPSSVSKLFPWKAFGGAFLFVGVVVGIAELNFTVTRLGIMKANSTDPKIQNEGVALLRKYGDTDYLLRLSYDGGAAVTSDLLLRVFAADTTPPDRDTQRSISKQAQKAYYRLTGKSYRQANTPRSARNWERIEAFDDLDANGSFRVNPGLSLSASQIDGSVDADAALGYVEWTLVFKNESFGQTEAVSQIQLPPGSVVSRLTLWINGEEREAAFAKSAKVIEAYNAVTARRLDPALVTETGKDRVQLKCFPVPANGEMKVRLGITMPVVLEDAATGFVAMPYFQDRNFVISTEHSIWVESKSDLAIANPAIRHERGVELFGVRGRVSDDQLIKIGSPIKVSRRTGLKTAWAKDTLGDGFVVKQELREVPRPPVNRMIFVIDPTIQMAEFRDQIVDAVRKLPAETATALIFSGGNGLNAETLEPDSFEGTPGETADRIAKATFDGGVDAVPAIEIAWEMAHAAPGNAIVWVHGPQLVEFDSPARLTQLWTRRPTEVPIFSLQIGTGRNSVERVLNESNAVSTILRFGSPGEDLTRLFEDLVSGQVSFAAVRTVEKAPPASGATTTKTSQHLVRLWANDETLRLLKQGDEPKAIEVAVKNQLVTRVSGAVVLETQAQYDQFGLKPVDPNSVPTIPEPEEYLLFAVVLAFLAYFGWRFSRLRLGTA